MLVRRRLVGLSLNSRVNLRMVETTTTTAVNITIVIVMVRREGILITSNLTAIRGHRQIMEEIGRVLCNTHHVLSVRRNILENAAQTPRNVLIVVRKDT